MINKKNLLIVSGLLALSIIGYYAWVKFSKKPITREQKENRYIQIVRV